MKICVITVSNSEMISDKTNATLNSICSQLYKNNQELLSKQVLRAKSGILEKSLEYAFNEADCVLLVCDNENERFYMCKNVLCNYFKTQLVVNEYAKKTIEEVLKRENKPLKKEEMNCVQMPEGARTIKNPFSTYQGCLMEKDGKFLFLLPLEPKELHHLFFSSVLPYIKQVGNQVNGKIYVLKTFGIKYADMQILLKDYIKNKIGVEVLCSENLLSGEVIIRVPKGTRSDYAETLIQNIYRQILPFVYADKDETQAEFLQELMSLHHIKLAIAEDFTAGRMASTIYENVKNAQEILEEDYIALTNESKIKLLGVSEEIFKKEKVDYAEVAYEMALGCLENSGANVVATNCGNLETGEVFYAIGNHEGIHVFNSEVSGSREQKMETATNTIFFELIKKIKQNDFHLGQITV